jgi:ParB family transcriptional regulator, chromosome partitioning protein
VAKSSSKSRGLGRGLSALMSDVTQDQDTTAPEQPRRPDRSLPIEAIRPNPDQPRRSFNDDALSELAASIREKGVIQPLIVRPDPEDASLYQIVAGERRWRAAQMAQLHEVPVLVRDFTDTEVLEVAIIENIQRADLNAIDEASGYKQLMDRFGHTQDQLATALGKSRSHIANQMRLLSLPDAVQAFLVDGTLSAGHARALIGHDRAEEIARKVVSAKLSVRGVEKLMKAQKAGSEPKSRTRLDKDADTQQIERDLAAQLKMGVTIDHAPGGEGGSLTIRYKSLDELDDLLRTLSGG